MAEKKERKRKSVGTAARRRRKPAGASISLSPSELQAESPTADVIELQNSIVSDGGKTLATYREPFGGRWLVMAALPIEKVQATPYQRNLSDAHVRKLETVISKLGR